MSREISFDKKMEEFLNSKFLLECIFTIPLIIYLIFLGFLKFQARKISIYFNKPYAYSLALKEKKIFFLMIYFSYEVFYIFKSYDHLIISDQLMIVLTIFIKILCCVFIVVIIRENALKNIKSSTYHILFFFIIISLLLTIDIVNEFRFEVVKYFYLISFLIL